MATETKGTRKMYYNCGLKGHMVSVCPYPKHKRDEEAHGQRQAMMSTLVSEEDVETGQIQELKPQLYEAQMWVAVGGKAGVMNTAEGAKDCSKLGPTMLAKVRAGQPKNTLVNTGSLATIASLDFILDVLAGG